MNRSLPAFLVALCATCSIALSAFAGDDPLAEDPAAQVPVQATAEAEAAATRAAIDAKVADLELSLVERTAAMDRLALELVALDAGTADDADSLAFYHSGDDDELEDLRRRVAELEAVRADLEAELAAQRMRADETELYRAAGEARRAGERSRIEAERIAGRGASMAARAELERALAEEQALEVQRSARLRDAMDSLQAREVELVEVQEAVEASRRQGDFAAEEMYEARLRQLLGDLDARVGDSMRAREQYAAALEAYQQQDPANTLDRYWRRIDELHHDPDPRLDFTEGGHRIDFTEGDGGSGAIRILIEGLPPGRKNIEFEIEDLEGGHDRFFHEAHPGAAHGDSAESFFSWHELDAGDSPTSVFDFTDGHGPSGEHDYTFELESGAFGDVSDCDTYGIEIGGIDFVEGEYTDLWSDQFQLDSVDFEVEYEDLGAEYEDLFEPYELDFTEFEEGDLDFWIETDLCEEDPGVSAADTERHAFWAAIALEHEGDSAPVAWSHPVASEEEDDEALLLELRDLVQEIRADVHELRDSVRSLRAEVRGRSGGRR